MGIIGVLSQTTCGLCRYFIGEFSFLSPPPSSPFTKIERKRTKGKRLSEPPYFGEKPNGSSGGFFHLKSVAHALGRYFFDEFSFSVLGAVHHTQIHLILGMHTSLRW